MGEQAGHMDTAHPLVCATVTGRSTAELRARRDAHDGGGPGRGPARLGRRSRRRPAPSPAGLCPSSSPAGAATKAGGSAGASRSGARCSWPPSTPAPTTSISSSATGSTTWSDARRGRHIVLSLHDFEGCPADLEARVDAMAALRPDVLKVAVTVSRLADCGRLAAIGRQHAGRRMVLIAMGEAGLATRVLPGRFGSCWTYAGDGVAPGQIDTERLLGRVPVPPHRPAHRALRHRRPAGRALAVARHAQRRLRSRWASTRSTCPSRPPTSTTCSTACAMLGLAGASVTAPFKVERDDGPGVVRRGCAAHRRGQHARARRRTAGTGTTPTSRGFCAGCAGLELDGTARRGARDRRRGAGRRAGGAACRGGGDLLRPRPGEGRARWPRRSASARRLGPCRAGAWDLLVNATPVGTHPGTDQSPFPESDYDGGVVYDLVYNPRADAVPARGVRARVPDDRRARHARGPGEAAGRTLDGPAAGCRRRCARRRNRTLSRQAERT